MGMHLLNICLGDFEDMAHKCSPDTSPRCNTVFKQGSGNGFTFHNSKYFPLSVGFMWNFIIKIQTKPVIKQKSYYQPWGEILH